MPSRIPPLRGPSVAHLFQSQNPGTPLLECKIHTCLVSGTGQPPSVILGPSAHVSGAPSGCPSRSACRPGTPPGIHLGSLETCHSCNAEMFWGHCTARKASPYIQTIRSGIEMRSSTLPQMRSLTGCICHGFTGSGLVGLAAR